MCPGVRVVAPRNMRGQHYGGKTPTGWFESRDTERGVASRSGSNKSPDGAGEISEPPRSLPQPVEQWRRRVVERSRRLTAADSRLTVSS
jgi:hypothetical protein